MKKVLYLLIFFSLTTAFQNETYSQVLQEAGTQKTDDGGGGSGCLICELEKYFGKYMGWGTSNTKGSWTKEKDSRTVYSGGGWSTRTTDTEGNQVSYGRDIYGRPVVSQAYLNNLYDSNKSEYYRIKDLIKKEEQKCSCILILR